MLPLSGVVTPFLSYGRTAMLANFAVIGMLEAISHRGREEDGRAPFRGVTVTVGAIFAVALARVSDVSELPGERCALVAGAGDPLWRVCDSNAQGAPHAPEEASAESRSTGVTLLVGAEREGLPEELVGACERVAHIPIASESLNAAMAATVALYEMTRPSTRVPAS